jgi:hypothetical protein
MSQPKRVPLATSLSRYIPFYIKELGNIAPAPIPALAMDYLCKTSMIPTSGRTILLGQYPSEGWRPAYGSWPPEEIRDDTPVVDVNCG